MLIGIISDTHTQHSFLSIPKEIDLLIHAGDICSYGTEGELSSFNKWCGELHLPKERIIVIAGNHDRCIQTHGKKWAKETLSNCTYIEDEFIEVEGIKIYGTPWVPTYGHWAFMLDRFTDRMQRQRDAIPEGMDIVVCHGPMYEVLDEVKTVWQMYEKVENTGCLQLREAIVQKKPKYFISGHIHEARGYREFEGIHCYNAAVLNDSYARHNSPIITFNIDK